MKNNLPSSETLYHNLAAWEIDAYARTLFQQHGSLAPITVLDKVDVFETKRDWRNADTWRRIGLRLGTLLRESTHR